MTRDDGEADPVLASVASLATCDVSPRRARRLRERCHARLQTQPGGQRTAGLTMGTLVRQVLVPGLGAAWCLAYLADIIRHAAAVYGSLP